MALLLPLLAFLQTLPAPGHPAELLPAPTLVMLPGRLDLRGPGGDEAVTLRCLAPITARVALYLFYRRAEPRSPRTNFRNSSVPNIEDTALPGLYSCAYMEPGHRGGGPSLESPLTPFLPPWGHLPTMHPGVPTAPAPWDNGTAGHRRLVPGRSASCRRHPSPAFAAAALAFLLPRGCR